MNIATNPWSFVPGDVLTSVPVASPNGLVQDPNTLAKVTLTTVGAHGLAVGNFVTLIGTTNGRFLGLYRVFSITSATVAVLVNVSAPTSGSPFNTVLVGDGGGTVLVCQVQQNVRVEDISWQNIAAAGHVLDIRDRNGLPIWQATGQSAGQQNRGKIYWVDGISLASLQSGVVLVTIN